MTVETETNAIEPVLVVERPAPHVSLLQLNRPAARNALDAALRRALAEAFEAIGADTEIRCVVLTGDARAFAAGADLKEAVGRSAIDQLLGPAHRLWRSIAQCPKPVVAAVAGVALGGGCELAMHADIIVAGESARFGQPEIKVGIMPGAGGTQRLVRAVGKFRAMKLLLTGEPVTAAEALAMGLVSEVVADDRVRARALELAATIAAMPPLAARLIKECVLLGADAPLETALALERRAFELLFASADQEEGMRAFLERRKPVFEGR